MKTLVLVFHPNLEESRVNRAIAEGLEHCDDVIVWFLVLFHEFLLIMLDVDYIIAHIASVSNYPYHTVNWLSISSVFLNAWPSSGSLKPSPLFK